MFHSVPYESLYIPVYVLETLVITYDLYLLFHYYISIKKILKSNSLVIIVNEH